jgi:hypothetical protein
MLITGRLLLLLRCQSREFDAHARKRRRFEVVLML